MFRNIRHYYVRKSLWFFNHTRYLQKQKLLSPDNQIDLIRNVSLILQVRELHNATCEQLMQASSVNNNKYISKYGLVVSHVKCVSSTTVQYNLAFGVHV